MLRSTSWGWPLVIGLSSVLMVAAENDRPWNTVAAKTPEVGHPATPPTNPVADNSRCLVCHANYEDELLAVTHAKANTGCVRCHGQSSPHSTDENGLTAPDSMYPKSRIRFACLSCHDWEKLVASDRKKADRADLEEKPNHQAVLDGTNREKRFCTDCHGSHRMAYRTRGWDKRTGKLTYRDGTPDMLSTGSK